METVKRLVVFRGLGKEEFIGRAQRICDGGGGGGVLWDCLPALSSLASDTSINPQPRAVRHFLDLEGKFISLAD